MYSGMAVRTAFALDLSDENGRRSKKDSTTASRTCWSIYSQDTEASCSSGRASTFSSPHEYSISYKPIIEEFSVVEYCHNGETPSTAMKSVIVKCSAIYKWP
ncbi:hypothetical protein M433DRAFT_312348 [Acidomyces richmondensis BFW]|nr:MAG: hypothetical protein FE78DRAFT_269700 [Acidomyces sp. 'richmondensis']KYG44279.1 hypothetical protein M433DRAFT_312348 [Acidomyces richmondensis BFW]